MSRPTPAPLVDPAAATFPPYYWPGRFTKIIMFHTATLTWDPTTDPNTTGHIVVVKDAKGVEVTRSSVVPTPAATATVSLVAGSYAASCYAVNAAPDAAHPVLSSNPPSVAVTVTDPNPTPADPTGFKLVSVS